MMSILGTLFIGLPMDTLRDLRERDLLGGERL